MMAAFLMGLAKFLLAVICLLLAFLSGAQSGKDGKPDSVLIWIVLALIVGLIGAFI
jgi:uncharacterized membrane protein YhhN